MHNAYIFSLFGSTWDILHGFPYYHSGSFRAFAMPYLSIFIFSCALRCFKREILDFFFKL